ncbi:MAG: adenylosuccinate synthase [Candidatus Cloacimonetes bacterium]|nr:adenylosuccinate synthase [Candidatus Cloacimonadota bacterium]
MSSTAVLGCMFGDEAKAKMVDVFAEKSDLIIRFQGGNNAGHTIYSKGVKYVFHLIPSGILYPQKICGLAAGVVIDPFQLIIEMEKLKNQGIGFENRFIIDPRANVVLPVHRYLDEKREQSSLQTKIGSTKRGIGPCYADASARFGLKMFDLLDKEKLLQKLDKLHTWHNYEELDKNLVDKLLECGNYLKPHLKQIPYLLDTAYKSDKKIIFEGAQGSLLDITFGTYPFVTSSNTISGAISTGCGFSPQKIDKIIGIFKSYYTRVGAGPFVTELHNENGEQIRKQGNEFGSTTGRPRRCGWFDAFAAKYTIMLNGINEIAFTLLDVLSGFEKIKICTNYIYEGEKLAEMPYDAEVLAKIEPEYIELEGWNEDISHIRDFSDLPSATKNYVKTIEKMLDTKISVLSVGPKRDQTIFL